MAPDFLVTGTDTGVGKTVIAAALLLALRQQGVRAIGFKPAETGVEPGGEADAEILAAASGVAHAAALPLLRLAEPLAPAVAAERAGLAAFDPAALEVRVRTLRDAGYRVVLEGAGGVLVPLAWGCTVRDLARDLGLRAIVVARAGLGTLNHCCLTVEALRAAAVPIRGIVLNGAGDALADRTNPEALRRLLPDVPVVVVPRYPDTSPLACAQRAVPLVQHLLQVAL